MSKLNAAISFDNVVRGTKEHVKSALHACGVEVEDNKDLTITINKVLKGKELLADYAYFHGIDQPLFRFKGEQFSNLQDKETKHYKLVFGPHSNPSLILEGEEHACLVAWQTVHRCLTNYMNDPFYDLSRAAGAFFQGGSSNPDHKYIYVEFWKFDGAQAWLDGFNEQLLLRKNEELSNQ